MFTILWKSLISVCWWNLLIQCLYTFPFFLLFLYCLESPICKVINCCYTVVVKQNVSKCSVKNHIIWFLAIFKQGSYPFGFYKHPKEVCVHHIYENKHPPVSLVRLSTSGVWGTHNYKGTEVIWGLLNFKFSHYSRLT